MVSSWQMSLVLVMNFWVLTPNLAGSMDGDARRGADFIQSQGCINCHLIKGVGVGRAPDLGQRLDRNYSPAGIAARMWSHGPVMWAAMSPVLLATINNRNISASKATTDPTADLFAYFYASRFFEKPGEAERGKRLFQEKHCLDCHSLTDPGGGIGPAVAKWESLQSPVVLIQRMWNHQTRMRNAMTARGIPWPRLTSQQLDDILLYLQNLPQTRGIEYVIEFPSPSNGEELVRDKGCTSCHVGKLALENRLADRTLTDIAAAMWNHAPEMRQPPPEVSVVEWRQLMSYVWAKQFFASNGNPARGRKVFESKKCGDCHNDPSSGTPSLSEPAEPYSAISMVAVLWRHGPIMLRRMQAEHISWPQFSQEEMANLIAYLNSH